MVFRHVYDEEEYIIEYGFEQQVESLLSCVPFSHLHATEVPMEWMSCWFLLG